MTTLEELSDRTVRRVALGAKSPESYPIESDVVRKSGPACALFGVFIATAGAKPEQQK